VAAVLADGLAAAVPETALFPSRQTIKNVVGGEHAEAPEMIVRVGRAMAVEIGRAGLGNGAGVVSDPVLLAPASIGFR